MDVTSELLERLCIIAKEAGAAIMDVYSAEIYSTEKIDQSPLTLADLRADAVIRAGLEQYFPGVFILSEESRSAAGRSDVFFLVDPLDGTKEFIKRNGEFTVNIALIQHGRAMAGVVYAPALGQMFYAALGQGAWRRCDEGVAALRVAAWDGYSNLRVIGSRSHGGEEMEKWLRSLPCAYSLVTAGSSLKFCRVAEGQADIYPRLAPTSQWDTAAAQCIVEQAGGAVMSVAGHTLNYGLDQAILNTSFVARGIGVPINFPA